MLHSQAIDMKSFFMCFILGGTAYVGLEYLWRGRSHISMFIAGGLAFALLDGIFVRYQIPLLYKCAIGAALITALEFAAGYIEQAAESVWADLCRIFPYVGRAYAAHSVSEPPAARMDIVASICGNRYCRR